MKNTSLLSYSVLDLNNNINFYKEVLTMLRQEIMPSFGEVRNVNAVLNVLRKKCESLRDLDDDALIDVINNNAKLSNVVYFDEDYNEVPKEEAKRCWVYSGIYCDGTGEEIIYQFTRGYLGATWKGCLVGTVDEIKHVQSKQDALKFNVVTTAEMTTAISKIFGEWKDEGITFPTGEVPDKPETATSTKPVISDFVLTVYNKLKIKNGYEPENGFINNFNYITVCRMNSMIKAGKSVDKFITYNNNKTKCVYNIGLLDIFGKDILVLAPTRADKTIDKQGYAVVTSKSDLIPLGFAKTDLAKKLERVKLYNDITELVFEAEFEDFDLDNWDRLSHCLCDRADRFKAAINTNPDALYIDMVNAIKLGTTLCKYDTTYVKPIYNPVYDSISFVIPYHVDGNLATEPELGIIVSKAGGDYWQVMTVIDAEDAKRDIRTLQPYSTESFTVSFS